MVILDQVSSLLAVFGCSGENFVSRFSSFQVAGVASGWLAAGSGLTPTGESGNISANVLEAPLIGLLSVDRYSALIFGNRASAVDLKTSLAKLVLGSDFFVFLGGSRFGVWNSCFLNFGLKDTFLVRVGQNTMCCLESSGLVSLLGVEVGSGGSVLISQSGGRSGSYSGSSSMSSGGFHVSEKVVSIGVFTCSYWINFFSNFPC
jgi:hypothetical protein